MISFDILLMGLMAVSALTSLVTEAVKKVLVDHNVKYSANTLTGIVAMALSLIIGIGYLVLTGTTFTAQVIVYLIALMLISWLGAMIGYDKVKQVIDQLKNVKKG